MNDRTKIVITCVVLKIVYLLALFGSSVPWDTSSHLLFDLNGAPNNIQTKLARRLMAWDVVIFNGIAEHGIQYEHENAFSSLWAQMIARLSLFDTITSRVLTGSLVSFVAHLCACLLIYELSSLKQLRGVSSLSTALIYAAHPAGVFLISGYAESICAAVTFLAFLFFFKFRKFIFAGALFGVAVQLRANSLIWGACFLWALWDEVLKTKWRWNKIISIIFGGAEIGVSFLYPQYKAYVTYCPGYPWCDFRIPSLYSYVQSKYWNVGFFRYWKAAEIPNFLLPLPTLILLIHSSRFLIRRQLTGVAIVQCITLVGAVFFWNVQIVTRISSCLPGPSLYLSDMLQTYPSRARWWIGGLLVWSITQSVLYGAFLPPA